MLASPLVPVQSLGATIQSFVRWLDAYGETSFDHQTYFAGGMGASAKRLYYRNKALGLVAVAPMIASEAFVPAARQLFWKRQRLPIADAHYAMGFAFLAEATGSHEHYQRAVHFLEVLSRTRSTRYEHYTWGYPFDWVTSTGTLPAETALITTVPYVYEAFAQIHRLDGNSRWLDVMRSIAQHVLEDYDEYPTSANAASCSYTPRPACQENVVNAAAYRAFLLTKAARDFAGERYEATAERNLNFVLESQSPDGAWPYRANERGEFIDHFHTCFVLKALAKIHALTGDSRCAAAIGRGVDYYVAHLFDEDRLPKPFSRRPRLTVYRRELYDYAECINLGVLLQGRFPALDAAVAAVVDDVLRRWVKSDGSFRSRQLLAGWDNVPMHRWAQAQMFRSLSFVIANRRVH